MSEEKLIIYNCPLHRIDIKNENPSLLYVISKLYTSFFLNERFSTLSNDFEFYMESRNTNIQDIKNGKYLTFEECCQKRVEEIIDKANKENKKIYVSLSGGVDSTCVTCSFLMNDKLDKSNFFVLYNHFTVEEYPLFIDLLKKNNVNCIDIQEDVNCYDNICKDNYIINGMCGDQLDGSNLNTSRYPWIPYYENWKDAVTILDYKINFKQYSKCDDYISQIEEYSKIFNFNLKYFSHFSWLFNFSCKWTYVANVLKIISSYPEYRIAFFDTDYFSTWCLNNLNKIFSRKQNNSFIYKTEWKKIILKYTKDMNYFLNKGKDAKFLRNRHLNNKIYARTNSKFYIFNYTKENILTFIDKFKKENTIIDIEDIIYE